MTTTDTGFVPMHLAKVRAISAESDKRSFVVVLEAEGSDQRLPILIGPAEALTLSACLDGTEFPRPMAPQFAASLVAALGGQVQAVRIDRLVPVQAGAAYGATVDVTGPAGPAHLDARPSDALNLAALVSAPIFVAPEVLADAEQRLVADTAEAALLRLALASD
jgi:bifunctional DNase/RNase